VKQFQTKEEVSAKFLEACKAWNKIHRIIGSNPELLLSQSESAWVETLSSGDISPDCFVDVGAGSGIAAIPLLWLKPESKVVFVELDQKKSSFLYHLVGALSEKERLFVVPAKIERVSRETIGGLVGNECLNPVFFARAFSGDIDLRTAIKKSAFSRDAWLCFEEKNQTFVFSPLKI